MLVERVEDVCAEEDLLGADVDDLHCPLALVETYRHNVPVLLRPRQLIHPALVQLPPFHNRPPIPHPPDMYFRELNIIVLPIIRTNYIILILRDLKC